MLRQVFYKLLLVGVAILTLTAVAAQAERASGPPNRYIVQVNKDFAPGRVGRGIAQRTGGMLGHVYTSAVKGFSIQLPPGGLAKKDIESQSGVLLVEPDVQIYATAQTLPTGVNRMEADNSGVIAPVDVDIAILDTGIDIGHPDLNVVGGRRFYSILWRTFEDDQYNDDYGHGSHCAGIAAARDDGEGIIGVAPGARLWAVKVLDLNGFGYLSDAIAGVDWVTAHADTIEVANMSLSATGSSSIFRTAIQNCVAAGVFCAVAAGNDSRDVYGIDGVFGTADDIIPAAYPEVATISAMVDLDGLPGGSGGSNDDSFASFSNYSGSVVAGNPVVSPGQAIDLLMPGVNIYSCYMNGGYATGSGTSMASPHAAGLAALYIAANGRAIDASGVYDIRQALINAGVAQTDPLGLAVQNDPDGFKENIGWAGSMQTESPSLESIMVTPVSATIEEGQTQQYTAKAIYSNGDEQDVTGKAAWFSFNTSVATIDSGLVKGDFPGITYITAIYNDLSSNVAILRVTEPISITLESIAVTPTFAELTIGRSQQYTATGTYSNDTTEDITTIVSWSSSNSRITSIDADGLATGVSEGTTTIKAELDGIISDGARLAVTSAPSQVAYVILIDVLPLSFYRRAWDAVVIIVVVDDTGRPIESATIKGTWSGVYKRKVSGPLVDGEARFETRQIRKAGTVTFTITKIIGSDGQEYILNPPDLHSSTTWP